MSTRPSAAVLDPSRVEDLNAGQVLRAVADSRTRERAEAAQQLVLACAWADQHPALQPGEEATLVARGADGGVHLPIAGDGCPLVSEYAIAEFGAVLGESTVAAKRLIGEALELRHRLPRLWALVQAGRTPPWRARMVAAETISAGLTLEAAAWVDAQVAAVVGKVGTAATQRLIETAIARFGLPARLVVDPDRRRVDLDGDDPEAGTIHLTAVLSAADGLDVDHALTHGAAELKALGSTDDLDSRRSQALGHLARRHRPPVPTRHHRHHPARSRVDRPRDDRPRDHRSRATHPAPPRARPRVTPPHTPPATTGGATGMLEPPPRGSPGDVPLSMSGRGPHDGSMTSYSDTQEFEGATFIKTSFKGATLRFSDVSGVTMRSVDVDGLDIDSHDLFMGSLLVNGVDVVPLVDAELNRRYPGRELQKAQTPEGLREGWIAVQSAWQQTVTSTPPDRVDAHVEDEWSLAQTLRHLVLATDAWLRGGILGIEQPFHEIGQIFTGAAEMGFDTSIFRADPSAYDEVLAVRAERQQMVTEFLSTATPELLAEERKDPWGFHWRPTVGDCVRVILEEEWAHLRYVRRDLARLVER